MNTIWIHTCRSRRFSAANTKAS